MNDLQHFESQYPPDAHFPEVEKTISFLKVGASCQILGLPGVGKSVLLRLLSYNRRVRELHLGEDQKKYHFVYMDFSEIKGRPLLDVVKFMLISLSYSLNERGFIEEYKFSETTLKDAIKFQDELVLFQALKKTVDYLAIEKNLHIVFLFDRFDEYVADVTEQFFANLKILRNRAKFKFACVFALSRPLDSILDPIVISDFYEMLIGNTIFMRLEQSVEHTFRLLYIESLVQNKNDKAKKELFTLTGGHGKLLKTSYEAVLANPDQFSKDFTQKELQDFLLSHRQIRGVLTELYNYLTPHEKSLLQNLGNANEATDELKYLNLIGLIKNNAIAIPLLEEFMKQQELGTDETLTFDEERNEISKGNTEITDQLTPSEFRLLKYLIINKGKVCEKEELINNVWKDSKTQEGVTDQALDQIIYRLRKKIEADPNNPQFITTIKGRGIKLSE